MASRRAPSVILASALSLNGTREELSPRQRRALACFAAAPERVLFPTPEEAAKHLAAGTVSELVLVWRAGLKASADGAGLAAPFAPPGGKARLAFRLVSVSPAPRGFGPAIVARYKR